jgi:uncharacterized protein DUF4236
MEEAMPIRFRRTFKILPWVKVNVSKGGFSITVGTRGFHLNFGKHGVRQTIGIPGSGLSETSYLIKNESDSEKEKDSEESDCQGRRDSDDDNGAVGCFPWGCLLFILTLAVAGYFAANNLGLIPPNYLSELLLQLTQWLQKAGL